MAYFGRTPKKPGSVPGAASGGPEKEKAARLSGIGRKAAGGRQARPGREGHQARAGRATRAGRQAR